MADKSKMSVAEILAAARKADSTGGAASSAEPAAAPGEPPPPPAAEEKPFAAAPPAEKPSGGGGRPNVADILAMARGEKKKEVAAAPKELPTVKAAPAPPAAKASPKREPAPVKTGPVDTQSILAAARKQAQPGPMTKAEAAAKAVAPTRDVKKAKAKEAIVVPPMPAKPDYAKPAAKGQGAPRRAFLLGFPLLASMLAVGFTALSATMLAWTLAAVRFMFPNILREPPSRFKVGFPDQYPAGQVETKFKAQFGVWIINTEYNGEQQIFALRTVCTHLGCTPNWLEAEQKFKCPCHGSGFYKDGINFEGPAPRPLERYAISIANDGQIEVDKSRMFQEEMGQWADPNCYIPV